MAPEMREMVLETLDGVLERDYPDELRLELDAGEQFPEALIRKMVSPELGLHLVFLPESVGGLGGGARDICAFAERMATADVGLATAFLGISLGTDPILVGGTQAQSERWLSRVAEEGSIVAYAVTEPEAGSNLSAMRMTADPITDASGVVTGYSLNGTKQFITNGGVADLYTVLARAPGGPSFFVVERSATGLEIGKKEDKHGIRVSDTTALVFENVEVPTDNLLGGVEGQGLAQANKVFGYTRLMVGAFGLGGGRGALERAVNYAKVRVQSGSTLIEKQGYTFKLLVPNWIDLAAGRAYIDEIAVRLDAGEKALQVEGSIAKLWATEAANRAADAAVQALGGYGYMREYMVEKYRRDCRILTIYEGTSEIQQHIIALYRWKETVRSKGSFYEEQADAVGALHESHPEVGADLTAAALRGLNRTIQYCHRSKLTRHQTVMLTLADVMALSEVAAAFCRHAAAQAEGDGTEAGVLAAASRVLARRALSQMITAASTCATGFLDGEDEGASAGVEELLCSVREGHDPARLAGALLDMGAIAELLRSD